MSVMHYFLSSEFSRSPHHAHRLDVIALLNNRSIVCSFSFCHKPTCYITLLCVTYFYKIASPVAHLLLLGYLGVFLLLATLLTRDSKLCSLFSLFHCHALAVTDLPIISDFGSEQSFSQHVSLHIKVKLTKVQIFS